MTPTTAAISSPVMSWERLLCETRQRELGGGAASTGSEDDVRAAFDRDYDRTLFATPVRRLQDKAQVFPLEPNDSVRTRLTHSLEVSAVAANIARRVLAMKLPGMDDARAVQAIASTAGLLHDLGNPPFGHFGEEAIRSWFEEGRHALDSPQSKRAFDDLTAAQQQDFLAFEGNAQTLRLVMRLQILTDWDGLNLTAGTLSAACKYTAASDEAARDAADHSRTKPGYFQSEADLIALVRRATGTGEARHPLTFLVEAADDIVYAIIDLEDGVKKGVLSWALLRDQLLTLTSSGVDDLAGQCVRSAENRVERSPMRPGFTDGNGRDEALVRALRTKVIGEAVDAAAQAFAANYGDIMGGRYGGELVADSAAAGMIGACKHIGRRHVYGAEEVIRREIMGRRVIHELMDLFWLAARSFDAEWINREGRLVESSHAAKIYALMSANYRAVFEHALARNTQPPLYTRLQLVTDNVAGMTDTYACTLHRELTGRV